MSDILRILQITSGDSGKAIQKAVQKPYTQPYEKQGLHTQSCTRWLNCHTMPYRKLYSTAGKPYSAIQGAVQDGSKAIQYGSIAIRCHIQSHTVQQKSHTVYIQKAIHEKR